MENNIFNYLDVSRWVQPKGIQIVYVSKSCNNQGDTMPKKVIWTDITLQIKWETEILKKYHYLIGFYRGKKIVYQSTYENPGNLVLLAEYEYQYKIEFDNYNFRIMKREGV